MTLPAQSQTARAPGTDPRWFIFGDSLSDDGAVPILNGTEDTALFGGRASTGLIWHETIRNGLLVAPGATTLSPAPDLDGILGGSVDNGVNFAHQSARTSESSGGGVPGALEQAQGLAGLLSAGEITSVEADDLFVIVVGGNDVASDLGATGRIDADRIIDNLTSTLTVLHDAGMARLFLAGVPTLGGAFLGVLAGDNPLLTGLANIQINALNARIETLLDDFAARGVDTMFFDTAAFIQQVEADPAAFGFDTVTRDCVSDGIAQADCPDSYFSIDGLHPTAAGQITVANAVLDAASAASFSMAVPPLDLIGSGAGDILTGAAGTDRLEGRGGSDALTGGAGDDSLVGGIGSDTLTGEGGNDTLIGNDGFDRLFGENGNDSLTGNNGFDLLDGGAGNDSVFGGLGQDTLLGGDGDDFLNGQAGFDSLSGGAGADTLNGNSGADTASGGAGDDLLSGGINNDLLAGDAGHDTLTAGNGRDTLEGGAGGDRLEGNAGSDLLNGGLGDDLLRGGIGADTFVFEAGSGNDRVADFQNNIDVIALDQALFLEAMPVAEDIRDYAGLNSDGNLVLTFGRDSLTFTGVTNTGAILDDVVFV